LEFIPFIGGIANGVLIKHMKLLKSNVVNRIIRAHCFMPYLISFSAFPFLKMVKADARRVALDWHDAFVGVHPMSYTILYWLGMLLCLYPVSLPMVPWFLLLGLAISGAVLFPVQKAINQISLHDMPGSAIDHQLHAGSVIAMCVGLLFWFALFWGMHELEKNTSLQGMLLANNHQHVWGQYEH
jgi:hypothetical protein